MSTFHNKIVNLYTKVPNLNIKEKELINVSLKICVTDNWQEKENAHMWMKKVNEPFKPDSNKVIKIYETTLFSYWKAVKDSDPQDL